MRPRSILIILLVLAAACGAGQRERTIKATLAAVNEARDTFVRYDNVAQQTIVSVAPNYERGLAALLVYRKRREVVVEAFAKAYRAIAMAATLNDATTIPEMIAAARYVAGALNTLKDTEHSP